MVDRFTGRVVLARWDDDPGLCWWCCRELDRERVKYGGVLARVE